MEIQTEKIGIYEVEGLKVAFLEELNKNQSINIDLSKVTKIELSAIQLFVSLKKSCDSKGVKLTFSNINENVHQNIEMSGCDSFLGV